MRNISIKDIRILLAIGVGLAIITVITLAGFSLLSKQERINPQYKQLPLLKIKSDISLLSIPLGINLKTNSSTPKTMKVFKVSRLLMEFAEAKELASKFGVVGNPREIKPKSGGTNFYWHSSTDQLDIDQQTGKVSYYNFENLRSDQAIKDFITEEDLVMKAQQFLENTGLNKTNLEVDEDSINYYNLSGGDSDDSNLTADTNKATIVQISFNIRVDGVPVLYDETTLAPVEFFLTKTGKVYQLHYNSPLMVDEGAVYPTVDIRYLNPILIQRNGIFVDNSNTKTITNPKLVRNILIEDVEIIYLFEDTSKYLIPTYLLRGKAAIGDDEILATIFLPAITEEWLK